MPPHGSGESCRTPSLPRGGSSSGRGSANVLPVSRNVSSERASLFKEFGQSVDPTHRRLVSSSPPKSGYHSDSEGNQDGYGTDRSSESRGRSRGSKSGSGSDATTRSRTRNNFHSNSDSANRSGRAQSQKPRSSSQASSTRSKRADLGNWIPAHNYGENSAHDNIVPQLNHIRLAKDAIPPDHGQRARSRSRQENPERGRSTNSHKTTGVISVSLDGEKYLKGQLANPPTKANQPKIEQAGGYVEGEEALLEMCSDSEEGTIKRKPIRDRAQSRGANSREHANQQPRYHGNEDSKELRREPSFEPIRQPPGLKQTQGRMWEALGKKRSRNPNPQANTNRGPVNEPPLDLRGIRKDWWGEQSRPASTQKGSVNEQKSKPARYYKKFDRIPSPASDKGRNHSQHSERYPLPDNLIDRVVGQSEDKKKKKNPSRIFGRFFGSWSSSKPSGERRREV
ncbi:hypothetical protein BPAE_0105g00360 [Botrytis paeoniae]|uniref:Uncharacterized protein n=1 Tax=Botrytis paeoniae TaxID=278948 RepID=A0A4Z1FMX9_9HELO|nr:hypothetical protein BPAE_0105g00360 [Botrytis paeoniae]